MAKSVRTGDGESRGRRRRKTDEQAPAAGSTQPTTPSEATASNVRATLDALSKQAPGRRPTREDVARRAYEIYLQRGGTHGYDIEDWLTAERELSGR
jgi:hypothetical protein